MISQNEPAVGTITVLILTKYNGLPNIKYAGGLFEISVNHQRTGASFKERSVSLARLLQEYYGWRMGQEALLAQLSGQNAKAGGQHASA